MQFFEIGRCLLRRPDIRFADDFDQRRAGPVQVNIAFRFMFGMDEFAGVLFHVDPGQADASCPAAAFNLNKAVLGNGQIKLGDLVSFGQVRVEIVFAGKLVGPGDPAVCGKRHSDGIINDFFVQHRQHAGHAETDRAGVGVRLCSKGSGTGTKDLALGLELGVYLQPDDGFKFHNNCPMLYAFGRWCRGSFLYPSPDFLKFIVPVRAGFLLQKHP